MVETVVFLKRLLEPNGDISDISYHPLGIAYCNAHKFASFSNSVYLELKVKSDYVLQSKKRYHGLPMGAIFDGMINLLFEPKNEGNLNPTQTQSLECFEKFMKTLGDGGTHYECLKKLQSLDVDIKSKNEDDTKQIKAQMQAVLACHLFSPLINKDLGEVIVDKYSCYYKTEGNPKGPITECPFCHAQVKAGNTNFGCKDLWHGKADIIVNGNNSQQVVKVHLHEEDVEDNQGEEEEDEEYMYIGQGEPASKIQRLEEEQDSWCSTAEVKADMKNLDARLEDKSYHQAISQTIVNSFYCVNKNPKLKDVLIPSFLVSQNCILINFYNVERDILISQSSPFYFFCDNVVNCSAFLYIWMALNFDVFSIDFNEEFYMDIKKCRFRDFLIKKEILSKYENEIEFGYPCAQKPTGERVEFIVDFRKLVKFYDKYQKKGLINYLKY